MYQLLAFPLFNCSVRQTNDISYIFARCLKYGKEGDKKRDRDTGRKGEKKMGEEEGEEKER